MLFLLGYNCKLLPSGGGGGGGRVIKIWWEGRAGYWEEIFLGWRDEQILGWWGWLSPPPPSPIAPSGKNYMYIYIFSILVSTGIYETLLSF